MAETNDLLNLLNVWGLENALSVLQKAGIAKEELELFTESDLDKIFPDVKDLGVKAKFRSKLRLLINNSLASNLESPILQNCAFNAQVRGKKPSGEVYNRYFNVRKKRRLSFASSSSTMAGTESLCEDSESSSDEADDIVLQIMKAWLKYNDNDLSII